MVVIDMGAVSEFAAADAADAILAGKNGLNVMRSQPVASPDRGVLLIETPFGFQCGPAGGVVDVRGVSALTTRLLAALPVAHISGTAGWLRHLAHRQVASPGAGMTESRISRTPFPVRAG